MVPNKFNIVDFGGFDLAGQYGGALPGIYDKIVDANWNCVYIMCFGLKFAGFDIAPQYMTPEMFSDHIMLNGIISIDRNDVITIPSIQPEPVEPVINPLNVTENGTFAPQEGVDGFAPVTVNVNEGLTASVGELFRHIMFSNSASDKVQRSDRWFQRNSNEPVLFLSAFVSTDSTMQYTGYAGISFSSEGIPGTSTQYGDLTGLTQQTTPSGTVYYVQVMNGMYPPSVDGGLVKFIWQNNCQLNYVPSLSNLVYNGSTHNFVGNQDLIDLLNAFIDAVYQEYYS